MTTTGNRKAAARAATARAQRRRTSPGRAAPSTPRPPATRRWLLVVVALAAVASVIAAVFALSRSDDPADTAGSAPYVGGDLHVLADVDGRLYVGGHDGAAVSGDGGRSWTALPSLRGADPMGWTKTSAGMLVGGHPGLYRSTDDGATFEQVTGAGAVPDVHAIGAAGATAYLASPEVGFLASSDGGATWQPRDSRLGQACLGTILVDPADPRRLIAPDMANGLVRSDDGGTTWSRLGGPGGVMSATWDPTDTRRLVAVGMDGGAVSTDGGQTWTSVRLPENAGAVAFAADGRTLYAAALDGDKARTFSSTDLGRSWTQP